MADNYITQTVFNVRNPRGIPGQVARDFPQQFSADVGITNGTLKSGQGVTIIQNGDGILVIAEPSDRKEVNGIILFDAAKFQDGDAFQRVTFDSGDTVSVMRTGFIYVLATDATNIVNDTTVAPDIGGAPDTFNPYTTVVPPSDGRFSFIQAKEGVVSGDNRVFAVRINYQSTTVLT